MGLFDRIERSGEAVANCLVHKDAQPLDTIEITSKLIETMDKKATAFSRDRTVAPNVFQVSLAPINLTRSTLGVQACCFGDEPGAHPPRPHPGLFLHWPNRHQLCCGTLP